ncbi:fused MFS/spermidine synthase [Caulifigura coniformis]|nr:fused MFS/spermidine synthase [Caulifigura coniformis]
MSLPPIVPSAKADSNERSLKRVLLLTALSGAAGLMHETLWTRRLVDLLGSTAEATSRVFGTFLLGLAIGAAAAAFLASRIGRPLLAAGVMELLVAVAVAPLLSLSTWSAPLLHSITSKATAGDGLAKLVVSLVAIGPASVAMGAVLPLLVAGVQERLGRSVAPSWSGGIYFWNLAGGVIGLFAVSLFVLPLCGLAAAMVVCTGLNGLIGIALIALDSLWKVPQPDQSLPRPLEAQTRGMLPVPGPLLVVAFASGAAVLAFEVVALRLLMLVAPICSFAPPVLLGVVLAALAGGAFVARKVAEGGRSDGLAWSLSLSGAAFAASPWIFMAAAQRFDLGPSASFGLYLAKLILFGLAAFGVPFVIAGAVFPLALARATQDSPSAGAWGWMLFANGIGGWLGAEIANGLLMPGIGPHAAIGVIACVPLVVAAAGLFRGPWSVRIAGLASGALAAGVIALTQGPLSRIPLVNPHLGWTVLDQRSDRDGTVAVVQHPSFEKAILISNQYLLGSSRAADDQRRQAHLALLLHPEPRDVAFIGIATGITPGAALQHPEVQSIDAIELSPDVADFARQYFDAENFGLCNHPKVNLIIDDARYVLNRRPGSYDAVIGDLILPWSPGEARLYSLEHFAAARRSLKPGGVYVQWLPAYQLTESQMAIIQQTFRAVFPRAELIRREFRVSSPALGLVGWSDDRQIDWDIVDARCAALKSGGVVLDPSLRHGDGVRMLSLAWSELPASTRTNTLDGPIVEVDAGIQRVTGRPTAKYLLGGRWLNFLAHADAAGKASEDRAHQSFRNLGLRWSRFEGQLLMSRETKRPVSDPRPPLPTTLSSDVLADWKQWPSDVHVSPKSLTRRSEVLQ